MKNSAKGTLTVLFSASLALAAMNVSADPSDRIEQQLQCKLAEKFEQQLQQADQRQQNQTAEQLAGRLKDHARETSKAVDDAKIDRHPLPQNKPLATLATK